MNYSVRQFTAGVTAAIWTYFSFLLPFDLHAESRKKSKIISCPIIVDRETGEFSKSKAKYRCYTSDASAKRDGYERHDFSDDHSSCQVTPAPTPNGGGIPGDYSLSGPGERETVVFTASNGGTVTYTFPGGGEFEIKVLSATSGQRLEKVFETNQASSGTVSFSAQNQPVNIKVEGPGTWTAEIVIN